MMSIIVQCPFCKVRFEQQPNEVSRCPICKKGKVQKNDIWHTSEAKKTFADKQDKISKKTKQHIKKAKPQDFFIDKIKQTKSTQEILIAKRRKRLWLVSAAVFLIIPFVLVILIDIINAKSLSWSLIVAVPLVFSWVYVYLVLSLFYKPLTLYSLMAVTTMVFLFFLNFAMGTHWFDVLGLVISMVWIISAGVTIFWITRVSNKGLNVLAIVLLGVISGMVATEIYLDFRINEHIQLTWSLITCVSVLPLVFLLFYLHKHREFLYRWFHL